MLSAPHDRPLSSKRGDLRQQPDGGDERQATPEPQAQGEELKEQIAANPATEEDPAENAPKGEKRGRKSELAAVESARVAAVAQLVAHLIRKTGIFERLGN